MNTLFGLSGFCDYDGILLFLFGSGSLELEGSTSCLFLGSQKLGEYGDDCIHALYEVHPHSVDLGSHEVRGLTRVQKQATSVLHDGAILACKVVEQV